MFEEGKKVVSLSDFDRVRALYGFNYPNRGDILVVQKIKPHPEPQWLMLHFDSCEIGLCSVNFAPLEDKGDMTIEEFVQTTPQAV